MSHHKRRRPKNQRNGCLMCKPHKDQRVLKTVRIKGMKMPRNIKAAAQELDE